MKKFGNARMPSLKDKLYGQPMPNKMMKPVMEEKLSKVKKTKVESKKLGKKNK